MSHHQHAPDETRAMYSTSTQTAALNQEPSLFPYHDFLTPEYSSENPYSETSTYTTPSFEGTFFDTDQIGHFQSQATEALQAPTTPPANYDFGRGPWIFDSQPAVHSVGGPSGLQHFGPQSDMIPNPPLPVKGELRARTPIAYPKAESLSPFTAKARPNTNLHLITSPERDFTHGSDAEGQLSGGQRATKDSMRATSPVVTVSMHNRGDSPARTKGPSAMISNKRSAASREYELLSPVDAISSSGHQVSDHMDSFTGATGRADDLLERSGVQPDRRDDDYILSINEQDDIQVAEEKNSEVATWLAKSETGSQAGEEEYKQSSRRRPSKGSRHRSQSHEGSRRSTSRTRLDDSNIPGPGVLLDEPSEDEQSTENTTSGSSDGSSSPPADPDLTLKELAQTLPQEEDFLNTNPLNDEDPLPRQFFSPWHDGMRHDADNLPQIQPNSSNAAIWRFEQMAVKMETASRAATWGTRRRLSDSEVNSIIEGATKTRHLSLTKSKSRARGSSIINKLKLVRTSSKSKEKTSPSKITPASPKAGENEPTQTPSNLQRVASAKSKSPSRFAGDAFKAVSSHLPNLSRSSSVTKDTKQSSGKAPSPAAGRHRSQLSLNAQKGGLTDLFTKIGGPPVPTLASPHYERVEDEFPQQVAVQDDDLNNNHEDDDDDDNDAEDRALNEKAVYMDLDVRVERIVPTFEGFKAHALHLNPRLQPFLLDRIAHEQMRRYKKLMELKVKHHRTVHRQGQCPSGKLCFALGGQAQVLPPRTNGYDLESKQVQFQVQGHENAEGAEALLADGLITPALFPSGIPIPPVKQLPAEFECPLCFEIKKFMKPSDWTKHVHEDVQPFSCTFPNCSDPKSFKRKADWVRHENERHRHLEWWQCNIQDCAHVCYRKDNFVQHLVREHKLPEPKFKGRGSGSSKFKRMEAEMAGTEEVWRLLNVCHFEQGGRPRDEVCKFCGNVCNTWKKVSSHLGKHMEQIALPVLQLVERREISSDTVISPIEAPYGSESRPVRGSLQAAEGRGFDSQNLSPYSHSLTSHHQESSGRESPIDPSDYHAQIHLLRNMQAGSEQPPYVYTGTQMRQNQAYHGENPASYGPNLRQTGYSTASNTDSSFVAYSNGSHSLGSQPQVHQHHLHSPQSLRNYPPTIDPSNYYAAPMGHDMYGSPVETHSFAQQYRPSQYPNHMMQDPSGPPAEYALTEAAPSPMRVHPAYHESQSSNYPPPQTRGNANGGYRYG